MSRHNVELTLVEMYAIKHALQKQVKERRGYLNGNGYTKEKREVAEKDQVHEIALIDRFDTNIREFREKYRINKPLTIDELRNMHDEIVWVKCKENKKFKYRFYSSSGKVNTNITGISKDIGITVEIEVLEGIVKGDKWVDGAIEEGYIKVYRR
jgi:hypothetical protein